MNDLIGIAAVFALTIVLFALRHVVLAPGQPDRRYIKAIALNSIAANSVAPNSIAPNRLRESWRTLRET